MVIGEGISLFIAESELQELKNEISTIADRLLEVQKYAASSEGPRSPYKAKVETVAGLIGALIIRLRELVEE